MLVKDGRVKLFDPNAGRGAIIPSDGGSAITVFRDDLLDVPRKLIAGEPVDYVEDTSHGTPRATLVSRKEPRVRGIVKRFENGFGFIERDDNGQEIYVHYTSVIGSGYRNLEADEPVEFSVSRNEKGPAAVRVTRMDRRAPLFRFADVGDFDARLEELRTIAQDEPWEYRHTLSTRKLPVLHSYLLYTFARLEDEGKIAFADDRAGAKVACFNTGLVTDMQEEIFAYLVENRSSRPDKAPWVLRRFARESDRDLTHFAKRPDIAHYFKNPADLLYHPDVELVVNVEHIIKDNGARFPPALQSSAFAMRSALDGAIAAAKRRVRRSYKTAIPQFYRNGIQLLLPLCLRKPDVADLALVVSKENEVYRASTILTLDMAFNNARLIAKPDTEWLEP